MVSLNVSFLNSDQNKKLLIRNFNLSQVGTHRANQATSLNRSLTLNSPIKEVRKGSTNRIHTHDFSPGILLFEALDNISAFDLKELILQTIPNKRKASLATTVWYFNKIINPQTWRGLNVEHFPDNLRPYVRQLFQSKSYEDACSHGIQTHYCGLVFPNDPTRIKQLSAEAILGLDNEMLPYIAVKRANIHTPIIDLQNTAIQANAYKQREELLHSNQPFLIPLEVLTRLRLSSKSGLVSELKENQELLKGLGLQCIPPLDRQLEFVLAHSSTKLDPRGDKYLINKDAQDISGLSEDEFKYLMDMEALQTLFLYQHLQRKGLELIDRKGEAIAIPKDGGFQLLTADVFNIDSLRILQNGNAVSKQAFRDILALSGIKANIQSAQNRAQCSGQTWKEAFKDMGFEVPQMQPWIIQLLGDLYLESAKTIINDVSPLDRLDTVLTQLKDISETQNEYDRQGLFLSII